MRKSPRRCELDKLDSDILNFTEFLFFLKCLVPPVFVVSECSKENLVSSPLNIRSNGFYLNGIACEIPWEILQIPE